MTQSNDNLKYHRHLDAVAAADVAYVRKKDTQYGASWKQRGGYGAFFTIVRPWDRLENMVRGRGYDVFTVIVEEGLAGPDGSAIACVRDVRRYLLLLEAEMTERLDGAGQATDGAGQAINVVGNVDETVSYVAEDMTRRLTGRYLDEVVDHYVRHGAAPTLEQLAHLHEHERARDGERGKERNIADSVAMGVSPMVAGAAMRGAGLGPELLTEDRLRGAVRYAVNARGVDSRSRTPDHELAAMLAPEIAAHLRGDTDGQLLETFKGRMGRDPSNAEMRHYSQNRIWPDQDNSIG